MFGDVYIFKSKNTDKIEFNFTKGKKKKITECKGREGFTIQNWHTLSVPLHVRFCDLSFLFFKKTFGINYNGEVF